MATIEELDIDRMASMLRLNVEATFRLTYQFLKLFRRHGFGHVINISSVLGTKVRPTAKDQRVLFPKGKGGARSPAKTDAYPDVAAVSFKPPVV